VITRPVRAGDTTGLLSLYQAAELAEIGRVETTAADITDLLHRAGPRPGAARHGGGR
jgi:hypothetical protein